MSWLQPLNSQCIQQSLNRVFLAVQDFGLYITLSLLSSALKTVIGSSLVVSWSGCYVVVAADEILLAHLGL